MDISDPPLQVAGESAVWLLLDPLVEHVHWLEIDLLKPPTKSKKTHSLGMCSVINPTELLSTQGQPLQLISVTWLLWLWWLAGLLAADCTRIRYQHSALVLSFPLHQNPEIAVISILTQRLWIKYPQMMCSCVIVLI